jgi:hypothetical protein
MIDDNNGKEFWRLLTTLKDAANPESVDWTFRQLNVTDDDLWLLLAIGRY